MATQQGYFLIADITGYTHYLSASELDHAQQTLTALLNLLIRETKPPLVISRLAGDAVISYALDAGFLTGQSFVELIEGTYVAFRRAVELMVRNTTCPCNACRNIAGLDLKFFVHHGTFAVQKLDAHDELIGSDINLIHRLLKNHVKEATGFVAYALYTEAALDCLGFAGNTEGFVALEESYEDLGTVRIFVADMHPVFEARKRAAQAQLGPGDINYTVSTTIALQRERVWDLVIRPENFAVMVGASRIDIAGVRNRGRISKGTIYECFHGSGGSVSQVVLEWQPFERLLFQAPVPLPIGLAHVLIEERLEDAPGGTLFSTSFSKASGPLHMRVIVDTVFRLEKKKWQDGVRKLGAHLESVAPAPPPVPTAPADLRAEAIAGAARESLTVA
jgi:hypothetical protein